MFVDRQHVVSMCVRWGNNRDGIKNFAQFFFISLAYGALRI